MDAIMLGQYSSLWFQECMHSVLAVAPWMKPVYTTLIDRDNP